MENKYYFDEAYYSKEELYEMYQKLAEGQKESFRACLAHFSLVEILRKCNYDSRYIEGIEELAELEAGIIKMHGADCGTPMLAYRGLYRRNLKRLINSMGKLVSVEDSRINKFNNGEWLLSNLVYLTFGSSFEKEVIGDLLLINYHALSEDECLAISDNFIRYMRDEEVVFYRGPRRLKK